MLNIVIPMAGKGSRFQQAGYIDPKPLIKVNGIEMIRLVIDNLTPNCAHRFIFLCLQEHIYKYKVDEKLKEWCPNSVIVPVNEVTEGAACTVLLAEKYINSEDSLMIANSDQWVDIDINEYLNTFNDLSIDGLIMTMKANDSKWSFVRFDENKNIIEVVEKEVVSDEATVGIYNFRYGKDFVYAANNMIERNFRVNGEFYVAPAYNELISMGKRVAIFNIGEEFNGMYGLGIPDDLNKFITSDICSKALSNFR